MYFVNKLYTVIHLSPTFKTIEFQLHIFSEYRNSFKMLAVEIILRYFT